MNHEEHFICALYDDGNCGKCNFYTVFGCFIDQNFSYAITISYISSEYGHSHLACYYTFYRLELMTMNEINFH